MKALLRKELRALLPLYGLLLLMFSGDVLTRPFTERLDETSWLDVASDMLPEHAGFAAFFFLVSGFMAAYAAFPREHDEGTIELLHALPVSRVSVLVAKVTVGLGVLLAAAIGGELTAYAMQTLNPQSFTGEQWRWGTSAAVVGLRTAMLFIFYCHGLLASFFRRFGWLPVVLIAIALQSLLPLAPELAILDPSEIVAYRYDGASVVVPGAALALHGALAALSLLLASALWLGAGERSGTSFDLARASLRGRLGLGCGTALLVVLAIVLGVVGAVRRTDPFPPGRSRSPARARLTLGQSLEVEHRSTRCCDLTYPRALADLATPVVAQADALTDAIGTLLGARPPGRVSIDMTSDADSHLGVASWTSVRVSLNDHEGVEDVLHTVAHEVAHTFQQRMLGDNVDDVQTSGRFFLEGSAEWVAAQVSPDPAADRESRRMSAAVWRRQRLRFDDLADQRHWRARTNGLLVYPLGEAFARALATAHGDAAVGAVLRTMATDAGEDYKGRAYWEAIVAHSGGSLSAVVAALEDEFARTERDEASWLAALPELGGGVARVDGGRATVIALLDRPSPPGATYTLAVRRHAGAADEEVRGFDGELAPGDPRRVEFAVPASFVERAEAQFGVTPEGAPRAYFTEWRTLVSP